jgi:hypothetical protein
MAKQDAGPIGTLDILTAPELKEALGHAIDPVMRALRGEKLMRMPTARITASGSTANLGQIQGDAPLGPESGYLWRVAHITVTSSAITDTARYVLYVGTDVTDYSQIRLWDAQTGGATPGQNVNVGYNPGSRAMWIFPGEQVYAQILGATSGNSYALAGVAAQVPAEMMGKLI